MTANAAPKRALIVIDVQNEYFTGNLPIEYPDPQQTVANIGTAMDTAHAANIPVIVVQQTSPASSPLFAIDSEGWQLHPVVATRPHDHYLRKTLPSAYPETDLAQWLQNRGIDTLTVVGYMTHNCDASTINHALHNGTAVEFLLDASGAIPYRNQAGTASAEEIHRVFSVVLQSRFAAVMSTQEWVHSVQSGVAPVRDNIYKSNQRARGLLQDAVIQQAA
ncbi:cysteine hydrolase family protein [Candidimonas nitroreducens]|uniref:Cysteine hydrolase n=1 Tax=Candidimonas nitroreducens TaxID=683354 RepID=A0A225MAX9_9BURK|nr:cysteine hydrolase family protein [Candidimonas nitroreducens]OWT58388.1 cysteine hydrolase [Candidimonas nitroreducens]